MGGTPRTWIVLGLILVLAALLRGWQLPNESAWYDEVLTLPYLEAASLPAFWEGCLEVDRVPLLCPVHPLVEYAWACAFGPSLLAARLLSLTCGLLTILLLFVLGARLYGPRAGLVAATVIAFSLPHIFFSQEVRRYGLEGLVVVASFASLYWAAPAARVHPARFAAHLCCNALMLWTSPFTLAVLPAQALYWILRRPWALRPAVVWLGTHGLLVIALLAYLTAVQRNSMYWLVPPTWRELLSTFVVYAGGRFSNDDPSAYLPLGISLDLPLAALLLATPLALIAVARFQRNGAEKFTAHVPLLAWLLVPALFWFVAALLYKPFYLYRWVAFGAFPLALFAGAAAQALPARPRIAYLGVLFAMLAWQALVVFQTPFRPDYEEAVARIAAGPAAQPVLVLKENLNGWPLRYAGLPQDARVHYAHGEGDLHAESITLAQAHGRLWVVLWRWDRMPGYAAALGAAGLELTQHALGGMPPLTLCEVAPRAAL
jgi:hypothetical protein